LVDIEHTLRTIGIVLAVGLIAVPLANLLRLPSMVVLVAAGIVAGPTLLDLVDVPIDSVGPSLLFTIGVALILFHGGLGVSLRVISKTAVGLLLLAIPGVMITAGIVALIVMPLFGVSWQIALLVGAVLGATDPAILVPLFERLGLRPRVAQTVIAESAINDPMSAILSLTMAGIITAGGLTSSVFAGDSPLIEFIRSIGLGLLIGIVGGVLIALMLSSRRFGVLRESVAATLLAVVALAYVSSEVAGGSPYLAAFVAGLIVGNKDLLRIEHNHTQEEQLETYVTQTVDIIVLAIFVVLGLNLDVQLLVDNLWAGLAVMVVFIFIARPATVAFGLGLDRRAGWTRQEAIFITWCRETGVVPVAVASLLLAEGVPGAELVATLVTFAVIVTLLLQATTAGWLARRLGLIETQPLLLDGDA
jgi:cell volume regulation protein A